MRRIALAVFAVAAVFATGCEKKTKTESSSQGATAAGPTGAQTTQGAAPGEDTLLIGEVGALTGAQATFGISSRNGIEMAINEANAAGGVKGKKISVRVYDDQSKPEEAGNAATRLISQDRVALILGEVASSNSLAMAPKAQAGQVPMITPSSTDPKVTEVGDYIFRVCFTDAFQGFVMAKFARENLKLQQVGILRDQKSAYSVGLATVFAHKFTEMGGKIVGDEAYSAGDSDFRAQLTTLKGGKPDGIYAPGYYSDVGVIARQARQAGLNVPLMGGDGWDSPKLFELGGSAVNGNFFSNHYAANDPSERVQKFVKAYQQAYGQIPDSLAALAYDAANVAVDAMRRAPDLSGPALRDAIAKTHDFPGVAGNITLNSERNAVKPAVVLKVDNGEYKYVATINP